MPAMITFDPAIQSPQSQVIPDATPHSDGVMTKKQAAKLDSLNPNPNGLPPFVAPYYYLRTDSVGNAAEWAGNFFSPTNIGDWVSGLVEQDPIVATLTRFVPSAADSTPWNWSFGSFDNVPGPRKNQTSTSGWNLGPGGGRLVGGALNGALGDIFESYYETVGGGKVMERHFIYVDPADTQTRWISFMGNLEAPYNTALYVYASTVSLGSGKNSNDPVSLSIEPEKTILKSPSGLRFALFDDNVGDPSITLQNGTVGNTNRTIVKLTADGQLALYGKTNIQIWSGAALDKKQFEADGVTASLISPNGSASVRVDDSYPQFFAGGVQQMTVRSDAIYMQAPTRPNADRHINRGLGASGGRFPWVAASIAVGDLPAAGDSAFEGAMTVTNEGAGIGSKLRVYMKNSADVYDWVTVFQAP